MHHPSIMSPSERDILHRLFQDYGTLGVAQELASVCRERADEESEPECRPLWLEEAARYDAHT